MLYNENFFTSINLPTQEVLGYSLEYASIPHINKFYQVLLAESLNLDLVRI